MFKDTFKNFRIISIIEGLSYLILVFIAMPIKYIGHNPLPVRISGMAHGILFIIFVVFLYLAMKKYKWENKNSIKIFIYSLIPFGFIAIENILKKIKRV